MNPKLVDVAVSVLRDPDGRVLLAERTARQVAAGCWELPGGKIDAGETAAEAAARELREEIGVHACELQPWLVHEHAFATARVRLHLFRVMRWDGTPHGREGQRLAWVDPAQPGVTPVLASNRRPLRLLGLPPVLHEAQVGCGDAGGEALVAHWPLLAARGARWLVLQAPGLAPGQRSQLVRRLRESCRRAGTEAGHILLAGSTLEVRQTGCAGLHSAAPASGAPRPRPPVDLWSVACTDAAKAAYARDSGADALLITTTPGARAAPDWQLVAELTRRVAVPAYVCGVSGNHELELARRHGATGIVIGVHEALAAAREEHV